jgi:hypothetical protein
VTALSKEYVCGRSLAGIAGSNPAVGKDVCVVCCTVKRKEQVRTNKYGKGTKREQKKEFRKEEKKIPLRAKC